jgi:hypothetical protein
MFLSRGASTTWLIVDSQASPYPVNRKAHMGAALLGRGWTPSARKNHRMQIEILLLE